MSTWLLLFLLGFGGTTAPGVANPLSEKTVSNLLQRQATILELAGRAKEQQKRYTESQAVLQEERLEWISLRDRQTVRIVAMKKAIVQKDVRLRELVEVLYKLTHATRDRVHYQNGRRLIPRDGRHLVFKLLEREITEKGRMQNDLLQLESRRNSIDGNLRELETLEDNFRMLAQEAETIIQQCLFESDPIDWRLDGVDKTRFDAGDWAHWNRIRQIKALLRGETSGLVRYRGMLVRPVAGPFMPRLQDRAGVYLSGKPGDPVRATEAGTVRFTGPVDGYGVVVVIEHEYGIHSLIGRVEQPVVKAGEQVRRAQYLGKVPDSKSSSVPVYLELRMGQEVLEPRLWLKKE